MQHGLADYVDVSGWADLSGMTKVMLVGTGLVAALVIINIIRGK